ncbi:hypothetical protein BH20ACT6_BH20ACT6_15840 [soil metagenome]
MLVMVLATGLVGLLLLNTAMQRSAFELEELRTRAASLDVRSQVLDLQVERLRSPDRLARQASGLGMVPVTSPGFVQLADGQVLGEPDAALAGTGPQLVRVPPLPEVSEPARRPAPTRQAESERRTDGRAERRNAADTPTTERGQRRQPDQQSQQRGEGARR